ncbi:hypothetical protein C8J30_10733 [Rhodobacter viridis]|uniref:DUF2946 family protein n=2 Tax=Rhodobacter viridis TaxID=1054202 RepID=A0A318U2S5_9RHOB|nr:hypothetical protein C8J30_10733 [Rhodobacter viridis]
MARIGLRGLASWAMLVVLILAAGLPASVMPTRGLSGAAELVLCSGHGPVVIVLDAASGKPVVPLPEDRDPRCKWGALHAFATDAGRPEVAPAPVGSLLAPSFAPPPTALRDGQVTGLPPATGPPAIAVI